jgi:methionine-rich copper-binding protein CopC
MRSWIALVLVSLVACVEPPPSIDAGTGGGGGVTAPGGGGGRSGGGSGGGGGTAIGGGDATGGSGGGSPSDLIAPELLNTTPSTGSMNVAVGQPLQLIFSEPMATGSVQLTATPSVTFGGPSGNANATLFNISHSTFSFDTSYTISIAGTDLAGNSLAPSTFTFRTEAAPDTTAPTLVRSVPSTNATGVSISSPVLLTFSEAMNRVSVQVDATPSISFGPLAFGANDSEVTLNPSADLTPNITYSLTVRGTDVSGNALAMQTFSFTTEPPRDTTPPALTSSTPTSAQANVATNTRLSLTFSEAIALASLDVTVSPALDLGTAALTNQDRTVTFPAPVADFTASRTYTVSVVVDDLAGNPLPATSFTFTTAAPPDVTRPTVLSTSPTAGATAVPTTTNLEFNFSEPMNEAATEAAFSTSPAIGTRVITWNAQHTLMSVNPSANLPFNTMVTMSLGTGARDLAGNTLAATKSVSFTTAAAPDTTPPTVTATTPSNQAVGVALTTAITVTFSEPMRQSATQSAFQITSPTGFNGGTFAWNATNTQMTYTPPADFAHGTQVNFEVTPAAEDVAGNALGATVSRTFRVKRIATTNFFASGTTDGASFDLLAGHIRTSGSCNSAQLFTDENAVAGDEEQGFMTFNLGALASLSGVVIRIAILNVEQLVCASLTGSGAAIDSDIIISHVNYGNTLTLGDCNSPTLNGSDSVLSDTVTAGRRTEIVTSEVRDDYVNRATRGNRSQWRVHTTRSGGPNICVYATQSNSTKHPFIRVTYEFD